MTFVAAWLQEDTPMLVGDLLISTTGSEFVTHSALLPSALPLEEVVPPEWLKRIVTTNQKIYRVSDELAIGWAGQRLAAQLVIRSLFEVFGDKPVSLQDLGAHLATMTDDLKGLRCLLTGWLIHDGKTHCIFWASLQPDNLREIDTGVSIIGDVSEKWFRIFYPDASTRGKPPIHLAISKIGNLLGRELIYGEGVMEAFGGGFELIASINGKLTYVDDILYFAYTVQQEESGTMLFTMNQRFVKHERYHGLTCFTSFVGNETEFTRSEIYLTRSILGNIQAVDVSDLLKKLTMKAKYYCVWGNIVCLNGDQLSLSLLREEGQLGEDSFKVEDDGSFSVSPKFLEDVIRTARTFCSTGQVPTHFSSAPQSSG